MKEETKPIKGFPNYLLTRSGKVYKWIAGEYRELSLQQNRDGYYYLQIKKDCKRYRIFLHRLLLENFVGPCPVGMECRHLDGNRTNNALSNLCWGTRSENVRDAIKHGTHEGNRGRVLTKDDVDFIRWVYKFGIFTQKRLADFFHCTRGNIQYALRANSWSTSS